MDPSSAAMPQSPVSRPAGSNPLEPNAESLSKLPDTARQLSDLVIRSLSKDKAQDLVLIPLADKSTVADAMLIASGTSSRQVAAMAEHVREALKEANNPPLAMEGLAKADWVVIDANHLVVHLFRPEVRDYYNLERLWGTDFDAEQTKAVVVSA